MEKPPETWDWVKALGDCSIEKHFLLLREVVDSDVVKVKPYLCSNTEVELKTLANDRFVVTRRQDEGGGIETGDGVVFQRTLHGIVVKDARTEQVMFTTVPQFGSDSRCRLHVDQAPFELWQISQMALAELFFPDA